MFLEIYFLILLIFNFFRSENFISPTKEDIELFNSYFYDAKNIENRKLIRNVLNVLDDCSNKYLINDFNFKNKILDYNKYFNYYSKSETLSDIIFIENFFNKNHPFLRLFENNIDKDIYLEFNFLIENSKDEVFNSKNQNTRFSIIYKIIESLEDKFPKLRDNIYLEFYKELNICKYDKNLDLYKYLYDEYNEYLDSEKNINIDKDQDSLKDINIYKLIAKYYITKIMLFLI